MRFSTVPLGVSVESAGLMRPAKVSVTCPAPLIAHVPPLSLSVTVSVPEAQTPAAEQFPLLPPWLIVTVGETGVPNVLAKTTVIVLPACNAALALLGV